MARGEAGLKGKREVIGMANERKSVKMANKKEKGNEKYRE